MIEQFFSALSDWLHDNWMKLLTGLLLMVVGWVFGKRRARSEFKKREFYHRLNVSLNILPPNEPLQIRTLLEKSCEEVFMNSAAAEALAQAARNTTAQNPLLPLPKDDYWFYLNAVLNEVAEKYSQGEIRRDLGLPVTRAKFVICLTCESAGEIRTRKIRAMVIQKKVLENFPTTPPALEHATHLTRWETLTIMAAEYKKNPWQFMEIEICIH